MNEHRWSGNSQDGLAELCLVQGIELARVLSSYGALPRAVRSTPQGSVHEGATYRDFAPLPAPINASQHLFG